MAGVRNAVVAAGLAVADDDDLAVAAAAAAVSSAHEASADLAVTGSAEAPSAVQVVTVSAGQKMTLVS